MEIQKLIMQIQDPDLRSKLIKEFLEYNQINLKTINENLKIIDEIWQEYYNQKRKNIYLKNENNIYQSIYTFRESQETIINSKSNNDYYKTLETEYDFWEINTIEDIFSEEKKEINTEIPNWLKSSLSEWEKNKNEQIPDWLKWDIENKKSKKENKSDIPDWLKWYGDENKD